MNEPANDNGARRRTDTDAARRSRGGVVEFQAGGTHRDTPAPHAPPPPPSFSRNKMLSRELRSFLFFVVLFGDGALFVEQSHGDC